MPRMIRLEGGAYDGELIQADGAGELIRVSAGFTASDAMPWTAHTADPGETYRCAGIDPDLTTFVYRHEAGPWVR